MPKCTIDGKEIEVKPGTTVLQAALDDGIHIPHFCWHPDLPVDGNCRTCMVEVEKMPKLQIACNMVVAEGMVVKTASPKANEAQRTALEFLLVNHPIDCPVCDQAGECYLQDNYMRYGLYDSKIELEEKVRKRKVVDLGPIMLDAERCVLCSRCLRFEDVVTGTNSLQFVSRGDHTSISTFEGGKIEHDYAGNLADVCPVGALLSKDFRFKMRVWFLKEHESVCPGCSTGCNVYVDERDGEVQRLRARRNPDVNKSWLCDPGRALYKQIAVTERVSGARVRGGGGWAGTTVAAALDRVAEALKSAGLGVSLPGNPAGNERGRVRVQDARRGGGRHARLPRRRPAAQGTAEARQRAAARRPQPEHAGLPRPGPRQGRRRQDPGRLPRRFREGARAAGSRAAPDARGGGRHRERSVRRGNGHARGSGARPRQRRTAGGDVGRGLGYLHELPAPRAAAHRGRAGAG